MSGTLIRTERQPRKSGGPRTVHVYKCLYPGCLKEVRIRNGDKIHKRMCQSHSHQKRPYESIYNCIRNDWRKVEVSLTYEEFLEFTKITECIYCQASIPWEPYSTVNGRYTSRAYYLDRLDNSKGYSKDNCVVCCTMCNKIRNAYLTHDEMIVAMKAVLEYRKGRV